MVTLEDHNSLKDMYEEVTRDRDHYRRMYYDILQRVTEKRTEVRAVINETQVKQASRVPVGGYVSLSRRKRELTAKYRKH